KDPLKVCAHAGHTPKKSPEKITGDVTLVFEFGYLMLVKPFKDDLSWQVQRELVNAYFRPAVGVSPVLIPSLEELETMPLQQAADLLAMADKTSSNRHGQPGSAGMTQRRRELKVLRPAFARIQQLIQLTIPGLEETK
ncbi:MAG: ORF6N domain-containing protein, partial [Mixta calida]|nr:ORF6N domain-containing protein [Mixta calida]